MARPKFRPTEADRKLVETMAAAGFTHKAIARCVSIKGIDDNTLRKHFRTELDTAADKTSALVATKVIEAALRGEPWACCFWLKCRQGWKEPQQIQHGGTGPNGSILIEDARSAKDALFGDSVRAASRIAQESPTGEIN